MRNLKLEIEYDGTDYCGWQTQRKTQNASPFAKASGDSPLKLQRRRTKGKTNSIQEIIEKALQKILQEKIRLIASGRTDAGVHAQAQIANFKTSSSIASKKLQKALNALLPQDITISRIEEKNLDFHSRFAAKSKLYRYAILNRAYPSAFLRNTVYFYPYPLNIKLMRKEAKVLLGRHNFSSFQASDKIERPAIRAIKSIKITKDKQRIYIDIEADGFLYNMVRNIVGTLLEIGRGKLANGSLENILLAQDRRLAGPTAPARGLCFIKVKY